MQRRSRLIHVLIKCSSKTAHRRDCKKFMYVRVFAHQTECVLTSPLSCGRHAEVYVDEVGLLANVYNKNGGERGDGWEGNTCRERERE